MLGNEFTEPLIAFVAEGALPPSTEDIISLGSVDYFTGWLLRLELIGCYCSQGIRGHVATGTWFEIVSTEAKQNQS